ncbi:MAG: hypothetical protein ABIA04_08670 [Pseudomonadota bacterium]
MEKLFKHSKSSLKILLISLFLLPSLSQVVTSEESPDGIDASGIAQQDSEEYRAKQEERKQADISDIEASRIGFSDALTAEDVASFSSNKTETDSADLVAFLARRQALIDAKKAKESEKGSAAEDYLAIIEEGTRGIIEQEQEEDRQRQAQRMQQDRQDMELRRTDRTEAITMAELEELKQNDPKPGVPSEFLARHQQMLAERQAQQEMAETVQAVADGRYVPKSSTNPGYITPEELEAKNRELGNPFACVSGALSDTHRSLLEMAQESSTGRMPTAEQCTASYDSLSSGKRSFCLTVFDSCAKGQKIYSCRDIVSSCMVHRTHADKQGCLEFVEKTDAGRKVIALAAEYTTLNDTISTQSDAGIKRRDELAQILVNEHLNSGYVTKAQYAHLFETGQAISERAQSMLPTEFQNDGLVDN